MFAYTLDEKLFNAVKQWVSAEEKIEYNPILFVGAKEFVSVAISELQHDYETAHPDKKIMRLTFEQFFGHVISYIRGDIVLKSSSNAEQEYLEDICQHDILIFENFNGIDGYETIQQLFYYLFDKFYENGKRIILGTSIPIKELNFLENRVYVQVTSGLIINV